MTTATLTDAYRRERGEGLPAHVALAIARMKTAEPEFEWDGAGSRALHTTTLERDGFTVRIRVDYDDLGADEYVTFTDREYELPDRHHSVYRNPNGSLVHDDDTWHGMVWRAYDHRYAYCVPAAKVEELANWYHDHAGRSRSVAIDEARENVRQVVVLYCEDYTEYVVTVTAFKNGVELGSDSLGGVDLSDGSYGYAFVQLEGIIRDHGMIDNALAEARETLKGLCDER